MSVHYKFKAALDFSTVTFDGIHISVADLKEAIIEQKKLAKNADFDLQIMNAQTNEVYEDPNTLIPKNTSVTVARIPITEKRRQPQGQGGAGFGGFHNRRMQMQQAPSNFQPSAVAKGVDLVSMDGTEEEKIQVMMNQATADYDPSTFQRVKGHGQHGRVPANYVCHKCNQSGHWIKDCPKASDYIPLDIKKATGIPRSFMVAVDGPQVPGALITPEGKFAVPAVDHAAYLERNKPKQQVEATVKPKIPDELLCNICQDLLTDALLVPCCAVSYCDDCIRSALLESEDQECPGCHDKGISPNTLIPSRFLRTAVNAFKNETGYSKPPKVIEPPTPITVDLTDSANQKSERKLSLDDLPDDLFPHSPRKIEQDTSSSKKDEPVDLYDFNDELLPPVGNKEENKNIQTIGSAGQKPPMQMPPYDNRHQYRPRMPFHQQGPGMPVGPMPPMRHHQSPHQGNNLPPSNEPPPPGFEVPEDKAMSSEDNRFRHGPGPGQEPNGNRPPQQHPMSNMPFDRNQPPPGFHGIPPPGMPPYGAGPPPGYPFPGPGPQGPYRGPPPGPGMYGPPHGRDRFYDRRRPPFMRDRDRLSRERDRRDERQPGIIEDPLEEFNRLMMEKDRRKQMGPGGPPPRSRSPSFSPSRRTPSPFLKRRSPRNFSRSPTPKRKRILRRGSFSRSRSRSPMHRRVIGRVRSPSPLPPRRAPPFSPSPPRLPPRKYERDDYYDSRARLDQPRYVKAYPRERDLRDTDRHEFKRYGREPPRNYHSSHHHEKDARGRSREIQPAIATENLPPQSTDHNMLPPGEVKANDESLRSSKTRRSSQSDAVVDGKRESKEKTSHSHHHEKKSAEGDGKEESKSPKKVKKEKKKHKKKSRDEKEKKTKKKKTKSEDKSDDKEESDDEHSITSGSRRDSVDTQTQSVEHSSPTTQLVDKLTATAAPCDSTVRSPSESNVPSSKSATLIPLTIIKELTFDPFYKPEEEQKLDKLAITTSESVPPPVVTTVAPAIIPEIKDPVPKADSPQIPIPPSKWDKDYDDFDDERTSKAVPMSTKDEKERNVVTSEVVKRAENALFSKVSISSVIRVSESADLQKYKKDLKDEPKSPDKHRNLREHGDLRELIDRNRRERPREPNDRPEKPVDNRKSDRDTKPDLLRGRLDRKDVERRDRDRSRERTDKRDNERRDRSRDRLNRREPDKQDRSREIVRYDRRDRTDRREIDRDRRERSRDRLDRRDVDRRYRDIRPDERNDRTSNRSKERSPQPRSRRTSDKDEPKLKSKIERKDVFESSAPIPTSSGSGIVITRTNQVENWKLSDKFVPIGTEGNKPNENPDNGNNNNKPASPLSELKSESADHMKKPGAQATASAPLTLAARKQKGRINIKLSSSAKAEEEKSSSSSSSSDEDDDNKSQAKSDKHSDSDDKAKKKRKDKKKKAKRRRSNSTSSSSSSSDDEKRKKKKKSKKKKKKSKKKSKYED